MESDANIPPGQRTTAGLQHTMKHLSCKLQFSLLPVTCLDQFQPEAFVYTFSPKFKIATLLSPYLETMSWIFHNQFVWLIFCSQHLKQRRWSRLLWASYMCQGLLFCAIRQPCRYDSVAFEEHCGDGVMCTYFSPWSLHSNGLQRLDHTKDPFTKNGWWSCPWVCLPQK